MDEEDKTREKNCLGILHLRVHKGKDLQKVGRAILNIQFGDIFSKSKSVANDPTWEFQTKLVVYEDSPEYIVIHLLNEDSKKSEKIGEMKLSVTEMISRKQILKRWVKLGDSQPGEIQISSHYVPAESKKKDTWRRIQDEDTAGNKPEIKVYQKPKTLGKVSITLHSAKNLMKKDLVGSSDPYAVVYHQNKMYRSATVKNSLTPFWDFVCDIDVDKEAPGGAIVRVFDEDIGKDDFLGETFINFLDLRATCGVKDQWIPLDKCKSGDMLISAIYDENEKTAKTEISQDKAKKINGMVELIVHRAKNIEKKGRFGIVDPYLSIKYGRKSFISPAIKNRHNPAWNYKTKFSVSENSAKSVSIEVCDENKTRDSSLGMCVIQVEDIVASETFEQKWIKLENCNSGEILLTLKYIASKCQKILKTKV